MSKKIKVSIELDTTLPLSYLNPLQGELKELSEAAEKKLRNSILKHGFSFPFFVWDNPEDGMIYITDGHQRLKVLTKLQSEGYIIPQLPVVLIKADNINEAKQKLALVSSQYGKFTQKGVSDFFADLDFEMGDVEIPFMDFSNILEPDEKTVTVAEHERKVNDFKETELPEIENISKQLVSVTFVLHIEQQKKIYEVLRKIKNKIKDPYVGNDNENGNALFFLAESYGE